MQCNAQASYHHCCWHCVWPSRASTGVRPVVGYALETARFCSNTTAAVLCHHAKQLVATCTRCGCSLCAQSVTPLLHPHTKLHSTPLNSTALQVGGTRPRMIRQSVLAPGVESCWPGEATRTLFRGSVIITCLGGPLIVFCVQRPVPRNIAVDGLVTTTPPESLARKHTCVICGTPAKQHSRVLSRSHARWQAQQPGSGTCRKSANVAPLRSPSKAMW